MAPARMRSVAVRSAPLVTLTILAVWTALDVSAISEPRLFQAFIAFLAVGTIALAVANIPGWGWAQPSGLVSLGLSYYGAHVIVLGIDVIAALSFLTLLFVHVEVRASSERFAPVYARPLRPAERKVVDAAMGRAAVRIGFASALGLLVPILAANLALTGVVPARTIPTAVLLAGALVVVVALLALLPILNRRAT